jgi:hypothetical protein
MGSGGFAQNMCQIYRCSVVIIALTACVPLHETIDYRRASLQTEYESLIAAMQNFPWAEEHNPGLATAVQFSSATPPAHMPERSISQKTNGLIRMRMDLLPDQSFDAWHTSLPANAAADIKIGPAFDLQLNDKLVEIITPAAHFIWPESGAFVQPVAIQFIYNCGFDCSPAAYPGDGLLHMDMETGRASVRAMELTSLRDQRFVGQLDFSLNHRQQNRFFDQEAQLMFRFDNGQQNIWQAKVTAATSIPSTPHVIGGFGAADADRARTLLGHFSTD